MSRAFGKISEYNLKSGNWTLYVERLEMYFKVNAIDKDLWLPMLIAGIGDETYELLSSLASPKKPAELTYDNAVSLLRNHLQPKPSVMAERYRFRQRRQGANENVSQYVSELKKLAKYCDFGGNLEENLRDQLVCGLKCDMTRQRLFAKDNLSYAGAVRLATAWEAAERDAAAMDPAGGAAAAAAAEAPSTSGTGAGAVHALSSAGGRGRARGSSQPGPGREPGRCDACGSRDHRKEGCRFRHFVCSRCSGLGHLRRVCPQRRGQSTVRGRGRRGVNHVAASQTAESEENSPSELEEELNQLSLNSYRPT
ncbi:uncharacterized protein LOC123866353 [Maniola jurtina]|uniref:uncharacterized protein LOC123866353 n=1 Tax=Maniola jurtina TaxID=191418 RepID=UPI001E687C7A|nr:uncharacterized protein LOC123866353 [Maniola jurtina]